MEQANRAPGKVIPLLLVMLVLVLIAAAAGYYISLVQFDKKTDMIQSRFDLFEGKYEMTLTSLKSEIMDIQAYIQEKEGEAEAETKRLRLMSTLLKAKGDIISGKIALSQEDTGKALGFLDSAIGVLKEAYELGDETFKDRIEDFRLQLATVKGIIEVNTFKAQQELDRLWREIDSLTGAPE